MFLIDLLAIPSFVNHLPLQFLTEILLFCSLFVSAIYILGIGKFDLSFNWKLFS